MTRSKRLFDVVSAAVGLALIWPLFALIALLIKLDDGGPVFFRQERVGYRGRGFRIWKFRTMRVDGPPGPAVTAAGDVRITRVGQWLRDMKLDELPQVLNVLAGEMSLVGPRPEVPRYVASYTAEQRRVLDLVPGITDPASLSSWNEAELLGRSTDPEHTYLTDVMPKKIRVQLAYAAQASFWRDIGLLFATVHNLVMHASTRLLHHLIPYRRQCIVTVQCVLIVVAYRLAYELRYDFAIPAAEVRQFWASLPLLLVIRLLIYRQVGLFGGYWQHLGVEDLITLIQGATLSSLGFAGSLFLLGELAHVSRAVLLADWAAVIFLGGGVRVMARYLLEPPPIGIVHRRRTLVVGTGKKAEGLLRETQRGACRRSLEIVGVVADDPLQRGSSIHGVRLVGGGHELPALISRYSVGLVILAQDAADGSQAQQVVSQCLEAGVEVKVLPSFQELLDGTAWKELRGVRIEDLLGRDSVQLDLTSVEAELGDKVVLVTGGAGSIGSELARLVGQCHPAQLVLVDQAESPLYLVNLEIQRANPDLTVVPVVCDVTDERSVAQLFADYRPHCVLHAAAYKHVPMMECNLREAVRNNVIGTLIVAEAAATWGVENFVLISTDKAVNPSSIMGATKRIAERVVLDLPSFQRSMTDFRAVRFGNVLGSAGSVVPLFEQQVAAGGPVTVTDREVERYFMTISEAAHLVLQAATLPEAAGHILMLEMGEPVRIVDLAEKMIRLAGREPYTDIPIVFTGLRPGEKLREELMSTIEATIPTPIEKIRIVATNGTVAGGVRYQITQLTAALARGDWERVLAAMASLVPESANQLHDRSLWRPMPLAVPRQPIAAPAALTSSFSVTVQDGSAS